MPTTKVTQGWGTGPWGTMPWGGSGGVVVVVPPPQGGLGFWDRYEKVRREHPPHREHKEVRNVLFLVRGLRATGELGSTSISTGLGRAFRLLRFRHVRGKLGRVQVAVDIAPTAQHVTHVTCRAGAVEISHECRPNLELPVSVFSHVGKLTVSAQRNITDEDLIHLIAEML